MTDEGNKGAIITEVLAEYLDIEPEDVRGWVIGVERMTDEGVSFSSIWSVNVPVWGLVGYLEELKLHLHRNRDNAESPNGVAQPRPSRAVRRGSRGSRGRKG